MIIIATSISCTTVWTAIPKCSTANNFYILKQEPRGKEYTVEHSIKLSALNAAGKPENPHRQKVQINAEWKWRNAFRG